jgi:hypothetical protein
MVEHVAAACSRLVAQAAGWTGAGDGWGRSYNLLAWRLGLLVVFMSFPLAFTYQWQQSSHSSLADGLATATWMTWVIVVLAFGVTLMLSFWQRAQARRHRRSK